MAVTKVDAAEHRFKTLTPWTELEARLSDSTMESIASLGFDGMTAVQVTRYARGGTPHCVCVWL